MQGNLGGRIFQQLLHGGGNQWAVLKDGVFGDVDATPHFGSSDDLTGLMPYVKQMVDYLYEMMESGGKADDILDAIAALSNLLNGATGFNWPAAHAAGNGYNFAEVIRYIQEQLILQNSAEGTTFFISTEVTSLAITQAGVGFTISPGYVEEILLETDAIGLATGTHLQLVKTGTYGQATMFAEAVANLGARVSVDARAASVTTFDGAVVMTGETFLLKSTVADCTGPGKVKITLKIRRMGS